MIYLENNSIKKKMRLFELFAIGCQSLISMICLRLVVMNCIMNCIECESCDVCYAMIVLL